jgi:CxxC-x17-CxxC domain-containing protein
MNARVDYRTRRVEDVHFEDKTLRCRECNEPFTWTAGEQQFYKEKQLINIPARCPKCRAARKAKLGLPDRAMTEVTCAECGQQTTVPFVPRNGNPVYCSMCYDKVKQRTEAEIRELVTTPST